MLRAALVDVSVVPTQETTERISSQRPHSRYDDVHGTAGIMAGAEAVEDALESPGGGDAHGSERYVS